MEKENIHVAGDINKKLRASFYLHHTPCKILTEQKERPSFKDELWIILVSEKGTNKVPMKAEEYHKYEYPREYEFYLNQEKYAKTRLEMLGLKSSEAEDLIVNFEIDCIEQLAIKPCPPEYLDYQKIAQQIIKIRSQKNASQEQNTEQNETRSRNQERSRNIQSNREERSEREVVRTETVQQSNNNSSFNKVNPFEFNYKISIS